MSALSVWCCVGLVFSSTLRCHSARSGLGAGSATLPRQTWHWVATWSTRLLILGNHHLSRIRAFILTAFILLLHAYHARFARLIHKLDGVQTDGRAVAQQTSSATLDHHKTGCDLCSATLDPANELTQNRQRLVRPIAEKSAVATLELGLLLHCFIRPLIHDVDWRARSKARSSRSTIFQIHETFFKSVRLRLSFQNCL